MWVFIRNRAPIWQLLLAGIIVWRLGQFTRAYWGLWPCESSSSSVSQSVTHCSLAHWMPQESPECPSHLLACRGLSPLSLQWNNTFCNLASSSSSPGCLLVVASSVEVRSVTLLAQDCWVVWPLRILLLTHCKRAQCMPRGSSSLLPLLLFCFLSWPFFGSGIS